MRNMIDWVAKRESFRRTAESLLPVQRQGITGLQPTEILLNELLVHKVELEVQIEELRRASTEMEESRDRYLDLYDHSPVGFLTLSRAGMINEVNLSASVLLGIDRLKSRYERFSSYIVASDQERWDAHFVGLMTQVLADSQPILIKMTRADTTTVKTQVICHRVDSSHDAPSLRVTLIDLSQVYENPAN